MNEKLELALLNRYLKKTFLGLLLCLFLFVSANAQQNSFWDKLPEPQGWVNDFEHIFNAEQINKLERLAAGYKKKTGIEIVIVTYDTNATTADRFEELTLDMANTWGVGEKDKNNGVFIGISVGLRKIRIQNGLGIDKRMTDAQTKEIIDKFIIPSFKKGNYYQGTLSGLMKIMEHLDKYK